MSFSAKIRPGIVRKVFFKSLFSFLFFIYIIICLRFFGVCTQGVRKVYVGVNAVIGY